MNTDIEKMRAAAAQATGLLKVLGNLDRLMILCYLNGTESSVSQIELATGISQPTLSQQLGILRKEQLVSSRRQGKQIHYRLRCPRAMTMLNLLEQHFACYSDTKTMPD